MNETVEIPSQHGILDLVFGSGPVVQFVLYMLIILSIMAWAITFSKYLQLKRAKKASDEFRALFWETRNLARVDDSSSRLSNSPLARVFNAGYRELAHVFQNRRAEDVSDDDFSTVERALKRSEHEQALRLEKGNTFLATTASAAPFIGLFGTVWGIMNAFRGLSTAKTTTIQAVAPGISEALIATAIGLAAAIPAAIAYNYFSVSVRNFRESMDKFSSEFISIAKTQLKGR
ncbi:MAG: protein TolQ [Bdellovibrionota bacterium]